MFGRCFILARGFLCLDRSLSLRNVLEGVWSEHLQELSRSVCKPPYHETSCRLLPPKTLDQTAEGGHQPIISVLEHWTYEGFTCVDQSAWITACRKVKHCRASCHQLSIIGTWWQNWCFFFWKHYDDWWKHFLRIWPFAKHTASSYLG